MMESNTELLKHVLVYQFLHHESLEFEYSSLLQSCLWYLNKQIADLQQQVTKLSSAGSNRRNCNKASNRSGSCNHAGRTVSKWEFTAILAHVIPCRRAIKRKQQRATAWEVVKLEWWKRNNRDGCLVKLTLEHMVCYNTLDRPVDLALIIHPHFQP